MADYKETAVSGTQYQRCNGIFIDNTKGAIPTIRMQEEVIAIIGDRAFSQTAPGLSFAFDPAEVIELRNPDTGAPTGATMTGLDLYIALYSLYIQKALERDLAGG